jgi:hypothetical protein
MDTKKVDGDLTNVVVSCKWSVTAQADTGETQTTFGYANFASPSPEEFIAYDGLSEETVLGWVYASGLDKEATEESLATQLEEKKNPPVVVLPNPWTTES